MYEAHQVLGFILFGGIGLYLSVFWGSFFFSYIYGSYLHDGEKKAWSLPSWLIGKRVLFCEIDKLFDSVMLTGILFPVASMPLSAAIVSTTKATGMLLPYILFGASLSWGLLYITRSVIRLNKKLDKHKDDKNAHK